MQWDIMIQLVIGSFLSINDRCVMENDPTLEFSHLTSKEEDETYKYINKSNHW